VPSVWRREEVRGAYVDVTRERVSLNEFGAEQSANSFLPPPRTTGVVKMLIASTRSLASSACTSAPLRDEVRAVLLLQTLHVGDVAGRQVEIPQARGIGEDVDRRDPTLPDREAESAGDRSRQGVPNSIVTIAEGMGRERCRSRKILGDGWRSPEVPGAC
jgi:hypothetical protein